MIFETHLFCIKQTKGKERELKQRKFIHIGWCSSNTERWVGLSIHRLWLALILLMILRVVQSHTSLWVWSMKTRNQKDTLWHRSLTGGPRSGYGPRSHPIRTRTYSQKRRLRFKTWRRGASISTGAAFVVFTVVVVRSPTGGLRSESMKAFDIMK